MMNEDCVPAKYVQLSEWEVEYKVNKWKPNTTRFMCLNEALETTKKQVETGSNNTVYIYELRAVVTLEDKEPKPTTVEVFE